MSAELPPCWVDCPLVGQPIPNTPFITCKTPITPSSTTSSPPSPAPPSALPPWSVPPECTFTLSMLLRYVDGTLHRNVGLLIDLTDGRFYDPQPACQQHDIAYLNLYLPPLPSPFPPPLSSPSTGPPPLAYEVGEGYLATLFRVIDAHLARRPTSSIVIHDVYGFDLSLYVVARYLVHQSMPPSLAYQAVSASRPPGITHPQLVRQLYEAGEEEVEWDLSILERPTWMAHYTSNWTWSGVGERGEKRALPVVSADGEHKQVDAEEVDENKEAVRPAGSIRRKEKKKPAVPPPASSASPSPAAPAGRPGAAADPFADLLKEAGVVTSSSSPSPPPSAAGHSTSGVKRKAPPGEGSAGSEVGQRPSAASTSPLPPPSSSSSVASPLSSTPVHVQHSYLVAVKMPHLQRLLSTLVTLILSPASHYSTFPLLTPSELRAKLVVVWSWMDRQPLTRPLLEQAKGQPTQFVLSWTPVAHQCLILIMKEGTFLSFPAPATTSSLTTTLPPLYHVPHLTFPTRSSPNVLVNNAVASAVLLFDVLPDAPPTPRLLLTDLLSLPSHHPLPPSLMRRMALADSDVVLPRAQRKAVEGEGKGVVGVRCKKYFPLNKCGSVLSMDVPHEREGVEVVMERGDGRRGGRIWTWKGSSSDIAQAELLSAFR